MATLTRVNIGKGGSISMKNHVNKYWLVLLAVLIVAVSFYFTNRMTSQVALDEQKKMELWAEATTRLLTDDFNDFTFKIVENNEQIPVIIADDRGHYLSSRNIDIPKSNAEQYFAHKIERFASLNRPIEIMIDDTTRQYIYYGNSSTLTFLSYFPYVQLALMSVFLVFLIWALSADKRNEQNRVWIGLTKETAHQLGTPISSLMAWNEVLRCRYTDDTTFDEIDKDISRLQVITERFSKIGSIPDLTLVDVVETTRRNMEYMQHRTSKKIEYSFESSCERTMSMVSAPLYSWVIENLCKNAVDSMNGEGTIDFELKNEDNRIIIEITDSGKGIERRNYKKVFSPGFTTKQRGWGLGLSFAKRIVEVYHYGRIFVKSSDLGLGTTFRIELPIAAAE